MEEDQIEKVLNDRFSQGLKAISQYQSAGKIRELATYGAVSGLTLLAVIVGAFAG